MNRGYLIDFPCIGTAEDKTVVHISSDSADEGLGNAVGGGAGIAGLQAVEAVGYRNPSLADGTDKRIEQGAARHVDRTLHNGNIRGFCLDIHILEGLCCIAFFRSDETGGHLHAGQAQGQVVFDIFLIKNTAAEDNGDFLIEFFFKFLYHAKNFQNLLFIAVTLMHFYLFSGVAQMAAGLGAFNDDQVCRAVMMFGPQLQNDPGGFRGADDRRNFCIGAFYTNREVRRQAAPEKIMSAPLSAAVRA